MISEKEIQAVELSPTKKDFYQIWNELLETASKISERWDPTSTNESDPGIVLLKVLAALGDKLNYNIDKNTLEAFMPSATQQESMRKLCDMMGYSMKYYGSATTNVTIKYIGENWPDPENEGSTTREILIPKYSTLTDRDDKISYITLAPIKFTYESNGSKFISDSVPCIEGQLCVCENNGNINQLITMSQLDDSYRYYLPETQIAENGIFIYDSVFKGENNILRLSDEEWKRVDNLNIQELEKKCFKVCFDSKKNIPYIQFPKDVSSLIGDGLRIYYVRTNGVNGNISANTLSILSEPDVWKEDTNNGYSNISTDDFVVTNPSATTNGYNPESINSAYNNYKKTIGTFDTLVTCRDYMNKIYQLTNNDIDTTPLVSNIIVSDIRDDINRSFTLCEFNDYGIKYRDKVVTDDLTNDPLINHFDIVLYPFKAIYSGSSEENYLNSFKYSEENSTKIEDDLENFKTISHNIKYPNATEIVCIKNYLKLNAKITTIYKVNSVEESSILGAVYSAIYSRFNSRQLDFGESIPFEDILSCIENVDSRIKNVSLDEPMLYTAFMTADNNEYSLVSSSGESLRTAKSLYNKLAIRNILAGKVALFNYNEDFKYEYTEKLYDSSTPAEIKPFYPATTTDKIVKLTPKFKLSVSDSTQLPYTLTENEVIQFRAPSFRTTTTYPAYVNYYLNLTGNTTEDSIPAEFKTLGNFMLEQVSSSPVADRWDKIFDKCKEMLSTASGVVASNLEARLQICGALWKKVGTSYGRVKVSSDLPNPETDLYYIAVSERTFPVFNNYIVNQDLGHDLGKYSGIYMSKGFNTENVPGSLVDANQVRFIKLSSYRSSTDELSSYYVQNAHQLNSTWVDGLGKYANITSIEKNCDYELKDGEYLLINYTESSNSADTASEKIIKNIIYSKGTIIRPNFELKDSYEESTTGQHKFDKTSGFTFEHYNIDGMYSLGSSDQIEIRDRATLVLGRSKDKTGNELYSNVYIYWTILDEDKYEGSTIPFPWDNDGKYVLKSGEYFYFTDDSKLDMSWYGSGTEIIKTGSINIDKPRSQTTKKTAEEILTAGISGIDWWKISPDKNNHITFSEYQYINIVQDDKLCSINTTISELSSKFEPCTSATYMLSGTNTETALPKIAVKDIDDETNLSWEVRSLLQLNVGPTQAQTLYKNDSIIIHYGTAAADDELKPIVSNNSSYTPLSIKSNYLCQVAEGDADVRVKVENSVGEIISWINDFKIRTFDEEPLSIEKGTNKESIPLHNFGKYWTKIAMSGFKGNAETSIPDGKLSINVNLPVTDSYGIVMIYVVATNEDITKQPYITATNSYTPTIFNIDNSSSLFVGTWWKNGVSGSKYYLRPGINTIYVNKSTTITIYPDTEYSAVIILSDLDIINTDSTNSLGIAIDTLEYQYTAIGGTESTETRAATLLRDINIYDKNHDFYYNCRLENSDTIDINTDIDSQTNKPIETLASATTWYDYNNINNKFVISEIDSSYMKKYGISITKSSKR